MPQNWKTYKLGELAKLRKSNIKPSEFNGEKYIGLEHIGQSDFLLNGIGEAGDAKSNKSKFESGDILYGKIRPYFKKVYRPNFSGICSTDILVINSKNEKLISQNFLHQIIKTQEFTDKATETSSGTKMPRADWKSLQKVEYSIPPLPEQTAIASVLSTIDAKIENNLAINKTLEEMAMALYKEWFVDFGPFQDGKFVESELGMIPEGWEVRTLAELGNMYYGKMPKKDKIQDFGYQLYSGYRIVGYYPEYNCKKGKVIVIARGVGGTGDIKLLKEDLFLTNISICIENELDIIADLLLFYTLKSSGLHYLRTGSAQPQITINDLNRVEIVIPSKEVQIKFLNVFTKLIDQKNKNNNQNQSLTTLRDTLLPKLISGEVRLNEFANR